MSALDMVLLLGILAGVCALSAWLGHRGGDSRRDAMLMVVIGVAMGLGSGLLALLNT